MNYHIEFGQEEDGRWLAEVLELPGVLAYGANAGEAIGKAEALALRVLAERIEAGDSNPYPSTSSSLLPHEPRALGQKHACLQICSPSALPPPSGKVPRNNKQGHRM